MLRLPAESGLLQVGTILRDEVLLKRLSCNSATNSARSEHPLINLVCITLLHTPRHPKAMCHPYHVRCERQACRCASRMGLCRNDFLSSVDHQS